VDIKVLQQNIKKLTVIFQNIAKRVMQEKKIKTTSIDDILVTIENEKIVIILPDHFQFIEKGRKVGGKLPPIKQIANWITQNKIQYPKEMTLQQISFAIAKGISKNGIKARPFLKVLEIEIFEYITLYLDSEIQKKFNKI
jgi:hypothetical protein